MSMRKSRDTGADLAASADAAVETDAAEPADDDVEEALAAHSARLRRLAAMDQALNAVYPYLRPAG
jgi:hypothetical protein